MSCSDLLLQILKRAKGAGMTTACLATRICCWGKGGYAPLMIMEAHGPGLPLQIEHGPQIGSPFMTSTLSRS